MDSIKQFFVAAIYESRKYYLFLVFGGKGFPLLFHIDQSCRHDLKQNEAPSKKGKGKIEVC